MKLEITRVFWMYNCSKEHLRDFQSENENISLLDNWIDDEKDKEKTD